jgi:hypothetical protein
VVMRSSPVPSTLMIKRSKFQPLGSAKLEEKMLPVGMKVGTKTHARHLSMPFLEVIVESRGNLE